MKTFTQNTNDQSSDAVDVVQNTTEQNTGNRVLKASWGEAVVFVDGSGMSAILKSVVKKDGPFLPESILELLKQNGIIYGVRDDAVIDVGGQLEAAHIWQGEVEIAKGTPAVVGQDAPLIFEMDITQKSGLLMPDGSIDLRERNLIHNVSAEDLIARKFPASVGEAGKNVWGDTLPASDGGDVVFVAGEGSRLGDEDYEGQMVQAIYAIIDGAVMFRMGTVSVNPIYRVSGDVDYETGNIEFEKDVLIAGSVKAGFEVRAGGNVIIGGAIEPGASVRSKGNVTVGRGILGKTTRVVVMGELRAQFIQNAMVVVMGDLWCGRYIHNAQVRCGGHLKVPVGSGARSGNVVGGMVCATKGIDVVLAGSESVPGTILSIQADPEEQAKVEKLNNNISVCDAQISKLTRSLGVASLSGEAIKKKLALLSGKHREHYVDMLKQLKEISGMRQGRESERDHLIAKIEQSFRDSKISVSKTIYARTTVKFGEVELATNEDESAVTFGLAGKAITMQSKKERRL